LGSKKNMSFSHLKKRKEKDKGGLEIRYRRRACG
jgi:hypothetical protein